MKQRKLRRIDISTNEVTRHASFVFPFFDRYRSVRFLLVITEAGHLVFQDKLSGSQNGLLVGQRYTGRQPLNLGDVGPEAFHRLFHFDPWWTMRDADNVEPAVRDAIIATNVAARAHGNLIIRDLVFDTKMDQVAEVLVGDGVFRAVSYSQARPMPPHLEETFFG